MREERCEEVVGMVVPVRVYGKMGEGRSDLFEIYKSGEHKRILEKIGLDEEILKNVSEFSPMRGYTGFDLNIHVKINTGWE